MTSKGLYWMLAALLLVKSCAASGQSTQEPVPSLPSGPTPAPLVLPKSSGPVTLYSSRPGDVPPPAPELSDEESYCTSPSSAAYKIDRPLTAEDKKAMDLYARKTVTTIVSNWKIPPGAGDPWRKSAIVRVRFEILPDGSLSNPAIMMTSGRDSYDLSALESIKRSTPFAPPPLGDKIPTKMCMVFGYRIDPYKRSDMPVDPFAKKPAQQ